MMNLIDLISIIKNKLLEKKLYLSHVNYIANGISADIENKQTKELFKIIITPCPAKECFDCKKVTNKGSYQLVNKLGDELYEEWYCEKCSKKIEEFEK